MNSSEVARARPGAFPAPRGVDVIGWPHGTEPGCKRGHTSTHTVSQPIEECRGTRAAGQSTAGFNRGVPFVAPRRTPTSSVAAPLRQRTVGGHVRHVGTILAPKWNHINSIMGSKPHPITS